MKTGLVVEGGGMKCAYNAGILDRFIDHDINFDYCIGVSAGAANAASFIAHQKKRNFRFYTIYAKDKEYLSMQNYIKDGQLFGLQYIYGTLSNSEGTDPLDYQRMQENPCRYEMVATNAETGHAEYFSKEEMKRDEYIELMASSAIPVLCRPVSINGSWYYDGGVADSIPVERALYEGCDRIVVILSNPRDYVKQKEGHRRIYSRKLKEYPEIIKAIDNRHIMYEEQKGRVFELEKEGKVFVFAPSENIHLSTYSKNSDTEIRLYELGLKDYDTQEQALSEFLGDRNQ